jgi:anaerobic carbon-monoxide dehydrogenase iron sulfur subunit
MRGLLIARSQRCVACKRCVLACAVAHSESLELVASLNERTRPRPRIEIREQAGQNVPLECRHCENAQCVAACPTGAMQRLGKAGPVVVDEARCVGCRSCVVVCHYGVPRLSLAQKTLTKCDLCRERLDRDEVPACVEACPVGAIGFVEVASPVLGGREAPPAGASPQPKSFVDRFLAGQLDGPKA